MITFNTILQEAEGAEPYAKLLNVDEATALVKAKCGVDVNAEAPKIWRGFNPETSAHSIGDAAYITPIVRERGNGRSNNELIMNLVSTSPRWQAFPQRSRSLIGSTSYKTAESYGYDSVYAVYPIVGARLGICPTLDFWTSFHSMLGKKQSINSLIGDMAVSLQRLTDAKLNSDIPGTDLMMMPLSKSLKLLSKLDKMKSVDAIKQAMMKYDKPAFSGDNIKSGPNSTYIINPYSFDRMMLGPVGQYAASPFTTFKDYVDNLLDPKKNRFRLTNYNKIPAGNHEVWTDSPCIMIRSTVSIIGQYLPD